MSIIILFNAAKDCFKIRLTNQIFRQLDDHYLKDIGFYRDSEHIRPLADNNDIEKAIRGKAQMPSNKPPNKGQLNHHHKRR